jgi:hypothetical protein
MHFFHLAMASLKDKASKVYAIVIGFLGLILTGILIAVAVYAATLAFAGHLEVNGHTRSRLPGVEAAAQSVGFPFVAIFAVDQRSP